MNPCPTSGSFSITIDPPKDSQDFSLTMNPSLVVSSSWQATTELSLLSQSYPQMACFRRVPQPGQRFDESFRGTLYPSNVDGSTLIVSVMQATLEDMCNSEYFGHLRARDVIKLFETIPYYSISYMTSQRVIERVLLPVIPDEKLKEFSEMNF